MLQRGTDLAFRFARDASFAIEARILCPKYSHSGTAYEYATHTINVTASGMPLRPNRASARRAISVAPRIRTKEQAPMHVHRRYRPTARASAGFGSTQPPLRLMTRR
ncbi:hypothetical protein C8E83_1656 [Frondihabitans australicus]|uniref:Uncharacterized protein n=1 Tax=Frondihabitans australicus TaxID=386892 RepID=A0A495IEW6_9MICO|nr:hypothetical protein C8E83_1656 [Frondihabitans australicus]